MPCVVGPGPGAARPKETPTRERLERQFKQFEGLLPKRPSELQQGHIDRILAHVSGEPSRRTRPQRQTFWNGLWRAIILDRDDYRCQMCQRSGTEGILIEGHGPLALRLELDHIRPRSADGEDYSLANIRTLCRTCNVLRGALPEIYSQAELESFVAAMAVVRRRSQVSAT